MNQTLKPLFGNIRSLSHILLLQADNFSDLQVEQFSGDMLVDFHKHMRNACIVKTKVAQGIKTIFRECIEVCINVLLLFFEVTYHNLFYGGFGTLDCT